MIKVEITKIFIEKDEGYPIFQEQLDPNLDNQMTYHKKAAPPFTMRAVPMIR